ncbi:MAG: ATP-binding protein [Desulfococcaceae bacterium]
MKENHFLRHATTRLIMKYLQNGDSLNIYGPNGIGKTRVLEDIRNAEPENTCVILVSFKGYQSSFSGFCKAVCEAAGLHGNTPASLNGIIRKLGSAGKQIFLLIDDFHYLSENPELDPKFNQDFIDALNAIKNTPRVSLMVSTLTPMNHLTLFINKKPVTSALNLHPVEIPPLQHKEILEEINRRFPDKHLDEREKTMLASHLNSQGNNYELLEHYEFRIANKETFIDLELLEKWRNDFRKHYRDSGTKKVAKLTTWLKCWNLVINPFIHIFAQLKKMASGPLEFVKSFFQKLIAPKDDK